MKLKTVFSLIDTILILYLAYKFLSLWICPQADQVEMIYDFAILMAFEFIMVHSGVFMSFFGKSWKVWLAFIIFYGLFALIFNTFVNSNYIIIMYCAVVFNRMLSGMQIVRNNNENATEKETAIGKSAVVCMIYFLLILGVCLCAHFIPKFGLTDEFFQTTNYHDNIKIGGIFTEMPQVSMCFGTLYYLALALMNIFSIVRSFESAEQRQQRHF